MKQITFELHEADLDMLYSVANLLHLHNIAEGHRKRLLEFADRLDNLYEDAP